MSVHTDKARVRGRRQIFDVRIGLVALNLLLCGVNRPNVAFETYVLTGRYHITAPRAATYNRDRARTEQAI